MSPSFSTKKVGCSLCEVEMSLLLFFYMIPFHLINEGILFQVIYSNLYKNAVFVM